MQAIDGVRRILAVLAGISISSSSENGCYCVLVFRYFHVAGAAIGFDSDHVGVDHEGGDRDRDRRCRYRHPSRDRREGICLGCGY